MDDRILFSTMSVEGKRFYSRIFNTAILNLYAVRNGLFPWILCETDDPKITIMWKDALPFIMEHIQERKKRGLGPEK